MKNYIETRDGRRIPDMVEHRYNSFNFLANRMLGSAVGELQTIGRTNAERRQEVADSLADITETARLTKVGPNFWRIDFTLTHKIVPIDKEA